MHEAEIKRERGHYEKQSKCGEGAELRPRHLGRLAPHQHDESNDAPCQTKAVEEHAIGRETQSIELQGSERVGTITHGSHYATDTSDDFLSVHLRCKITLFMPTMQVYTRLC